MADRDQTTDPDALAWHEAFVRAHGKQPDVLPVYECGWFVWRSPRGWVTGRDRRAELRAMTARLRERTR